ncbi:MAG: hypothetical protein JSU06_15420 [Actinobacteria bacterium]|nr:hypothetical protein [Actinomycetota bacterium]
MPSKAEIRTEVDSVDAVIEKLNRECDVIWTTPPEEVRAMGRGEIPRGTGAKGTYLTTLIFAENELRTLTDETLWFAWQLAAVEGGADLHTLQRYIDELVQYKANMFDFVGLPHAASLVKEYVGAVNACETIEEFCLATQAVMTYVNRLHTWVDMVMPWGVSSGFLRVNGLEAWIQRNEKGAVK